MRYTLMWIAALALFAMPALMSGTAEAERRHAGRSPSPASATTYANTFIACLRTQDAALYVRAPANAQADILSHHCEDEEVLTLIVHDNAPNVFNSGDTVEMRTFHATFLYPNSGQLLRTDGAWGAPASFKAVKLGGTPGPAIHWGDKIAFQNLQSGRYMTAELDDNLGLTVNRTAAAAWETFYYLPAGRRSACFSTYDGSSVMSISVSVEATSASQGCGGYREVDVIDIDGGTLNSGDYVFIYATGERAYWSAQPNGTLLINTSDYGPWQRFRIFKQSIGAPLPINPGDKVALLSVHGKWVVAEGGGAGGLQGGHPINANRTHRWIWETFTLH